MTAVSRPAVSTPLHFIGGKYVPSVSGATFDVVDPATETLTARASQGQAADIDAAVAAAKARFDEGSWSRAKPSFRRKILFRVADLIEQRSEEIIALQSLEMGGPIGPPHNGPHPMIERSAWNFRFLRRNRNSPATTLSTATTRCLPIRCVMPPGCSD